MANNQINFDFDEEKISSLSSNKLAIFLIFFWQAYIIYIAYRLN